MTLDILAALRQRRDEARALAATTKGPSRRQRLCGAADGYEAAIRLLEDWRPSVWVAVTYPDAESRTAARIYGLVVLREPPAAGDVIDEVQEVFRAEIGGAAVRTVAHAFEGFGKEER